MSGPEQHQKFSLIKFAIQNLFRYVWHIVTMLFKWPLYLTKMSTDTYLVGKDHTDVPNNLLTSPLLTRPN